MYNPIRQIRDEWINSVSSWGKAAVILFYSFLWLQIGVIVYELSFDSLRQYRCMLPKNDPRSYGAIAGFAVIVDILSLGIVGYAMVLGATNIFNIALLTGILAILFTSLAFITVPKSVSDAMTQEDLACFQGTYAPIVFVENVLWPGLALVCAMLEAKAKGRNGTAEENQPLNS